MHGLDGLANVAGDIGDPSDLCWLIATFVYGKAHCRSGIGVFNGDRRIRRSPLGLRSYRNEDATADIGC